MKWVLICCLLLPLAGCQRVPLPENAKAGPHAPDAGSGQRASRISNDRHEPAAKLADLEDPNIKESSGIVASRTTPGLYWTHNDSGDGPFIYAFDNRGARRGVWSVTGAAARDWEDIAAGPGPRNNIKYLYIGDIGDNSGRRTEIVVYRIPEPTITAADTGSTKRKPRMTETAEKIRLRYPDGKHNAEALLVHPVSGDIYIVTKVTFANPTIYQAAAPHSVTTTTTLSRVGELKVPSFFGGIITGGDISPNGRRVALCDYGQGYEIVLPDAAAGFNSIWKQPIISVALGNRKQGEAITYRLDSRALLATSEGLPTPLIEVVRR